MSDPDTELLFLERKIYDQQLPPQYSPFSTRKQSH